MEHGVQEWLFRVLTSGDTLRQERLTRDLYDEIDRLDGLRTGFVEGDAVVDNGGRKGGLSADVALWVVVVAAGRPASQLVITLVREWCAKDRHRKVEVTSRGTSVIITGRPDQAQERIVNSFLKKVAADSTDDRTDDAE
jgi:hypothetical protein